MVRPKLISRETDPTPHLYLSHTDNCNEKIMELLSLRRLNLWALLARSLVNAPHELHHREAER